MVIPVSEPVMAKAKACKVETKANRKKIDLEANVMDEKVKAKTKSAEAKANAIKLASEERPDIPVHLCFTKSQRNKLLNDVHNIHNQKHTTYKISFIDMISLQLRTTTLSIALFRWFTLNTNKIL